VGAHNGATRIVGDGSRQMLLVISVDGRVELANSVARERLEVSPGENFYALADDAGRRLQKQVVRCTQTNSVGHCSLQIGRNHELMRVQCRAMPLQAAADEALPSVLIQCVERSPRPPLANWILRWRTHKRRAVVAGGELRLGFDDLLSSEATHRLKNNIQMILSMLMTAQRHTASEEARSTLQTVVLKLEAAVQVQRMLEEARENTPMQADNFLRQLCRAIQQASPQRFALAIDADLSELDAGVLPSLGLIVNELLTNAIKHGIAHDRGLVRVALKSQGPQLELRVEDNGPGFMGQPGDTSGRGLGLVQALARQLNGSFHVESAGGTRCIVRLRRRSNEP
jgi:two-component sensor histidine kinase